MVALLHSYRSKATMLSSSTRAGRRADQPASTTFPSSTGDASSGLCGSTRTV
jgi:hypothetical protein